MWIPANPNAYRTEEPDCVVRAIAIALDESWEKVHWELCVMSHMEHTMPSVNWLWGKYLRKRGFERFQLPDTCPDCVTVKEFAKRFPGGVYVVGTGTHAVCVIDGNYFDAWDSGDEIVTIYYRKRGK